MSDSHLDVFFADDTEEGAQWGLLCLMTGISEEFWSAGWIIGLEFALWDAIQGGEREIGRGLLTERQRTLLKLLSEEANGWWIYDAEIGPSFLSLEAWNAQREVLRGQRDGRGGS
jgi:hypothetical protein